MSEYGSNKYLSVIKSLIAETTIRVPPGISILKINPLSGGDKINVEIWADNYSNTHIS